MKRPLFLCILLFACCSVCHAGQPAMGPDAYGFDWLNPENAKCELIPQALRAKFKECAYEADGSFGLSDPVFKCNVNDKSEFLVYENEEACKSNLETMQANAP